MVPPRWLYRAGWALHNLVDRLSGGRVGTVRPRGTRLGVLFLTTVGARSGAERRNAVYFLEDGQNVLVVASNAGAQGNPAWWHNLRAHPEAAVEIDGLSRRVRARPATDTEAQAAWTRFAASSAQFEEYRKAVERQIPIVVLEPMEGEDGVSA